jgi:hypothetical protein
MLPAAFISGRKPNFKTSTGKYIKMAVKTGSLFLKMNINIYLTTPEMLSKLRAEETNRNIANISLNYSRISEKN